MDIAIAKKQDCLSVSWNTITAQVDVSRIQLGHMGCKLLVKILLACPEEVKGGSYE